MEIFGTSSSESSEGGSSGPPVEIIYKSSDQANNTLFPYTLDDHLHFVTEPDTVYILEMHLITEAGADAGLTFLGDWDMNKMNVIKFDYTGGMYTPSDVEDQFGDGASGGGNISTITVLSFRIEASDVDTFTLRHGKNAPTGSAPKVKAGSFFKLTTIHHVPPQ